MICAFFQNIGFEWIIVLVIFLLVFTRSARRVGLIIGRLSSGAPPSLPPRAPETTGKDPLDDYYDALEVPRGASPEAVRQSYKELVKVWHPDRFGSDEKLRARATTKLQEINAAYEKLKDNGRA